MGHPTIYPTGVTLYDPDRSWNGYTIFQAAGLGALLIDMNGREVQLWSGLHGFPSKLLPGGQVFGSTGERNPKHGTQDRIDLVQVDWEGNVVWRFDRLEYIHNPGEAPRWFARQHHDFQRQGNPRVSEASTGAAGRPSRRRRRVTRCRTAAAWLPSGSSG